tara:strand:+ start:3568 stop:4308 length:741 start_codon:yes stop_codon:yes gene_type:complete
MTDFLPGLATGKILEALTRAPGNEVKSGKIDSPESSAALVANAFGWFLDRPADLPPLPGGLGAAHSVTLEAEMRFPWAGGKHPWLDVAIETDHYLIGIESKRYEPFRPAKNNDFAASYDRPVWGENMQGYDRLRRTFAGGAHRFAVLDMVQLVKHAYGLRTEAQRREKRPVLIYLYAEPANWASGKVVDPLRLAQHRKDIELFARSVESDEVSFAAMTWAELLTLWSGNPACAPHAARVLERFGPL